MGANNQTTYRTDDEVIVALYSCNGNISKTASKLGLKNVSEFRDRVNRNPALLRAKQEAIEQLIDRAEAKIFTSMTKGDAKWLLERKGRSRGYGNVITNNNLNTDTKIDFSKIPLEKRKEILETINMVEDDVNSG